jgi:hypothetical protein
VGGFFDELVGVLVFVLLCLTVFTSVALVVVLVYSAFTSGWFGFG